MTVGFSEAFIYLFMYSVMGWICEVVYCSIPARKFINRGFLNGPYCPIYGTGALFILAVTLPFSRNPVLVFGVSLLCATGLEYFTGWLMEAIFQIRWWDYTNQRFNLRGRICLKNSLLFGLLGLIMIYWVHPTVKGFTGVFTTGTQSVLSSVFISVFILDLTYTLNTLLKLTERLKAVSVHLSALERHNRSYTGSLARLREMSHSAEDNYLFEMLDKLDALLQKQGIARIVHAFPRLKPKGLDPVLNHLREAWETRIEIRREALHRRTWKIVAHAGKLTAEKITDSSFYKLLWVFINASILGYVVETLFCLATRGVIESRQGLIYGPFSQVYGFGAVLLVLLLTPLTKKNDRWLFMGSALVGGGFEFLCSYIQEKIFGSVSWEYSQQAFSIGGRTSITYMFFWGILGLVFMKGIYPMLSQLIDKIPKRQGLFFSWVFIITLSVNMFLSGTAVYRWSRRAEQVPPANAYEAFLDRQYPDERLEAIYPNMTILNN